MAKEIREFVDSAGIESDRVKAHYKTAFTVAKKLKSEETVWAKSKKAKKLLPLIENQHTLSVLDLKLKLWHFASIDSDIEKAPESDKRFVWLHKTGPINPMAWLLARFLWLQKDESLAKVALEDLVAFIKKPGKKIPKPVGGDLQSMPSKFNYFTHWLGINFESPAFREKFDDAALSMAFEDVFKYKLRTQKREEQRMALSKILAAYEGDGGTIEADDSPTGKDLVIRGMKGDPRWKGDKSAGKKGIVDLLADLAKDKGFDNYGLRSGTIGGWADLRKAFLKLEKKAKDANRSLTYDELENAVEDEKRENRQGFGSDDVFKKLCQSQYHDLWSASAESIGIEDFISHFTRYSEWVEESEAICELDDQGTIARDANGDPKPKPISYTFPGEKNRHGKTSYRHFDFKHQLNRQMTLNLFRKKCETNDVAYELVEESVTLSARRLKRDKVMTAEGTSVEALWCPPLVLGEVKPRAGKTKKGKGGKREWPDGDLNVSFSLMVADEKPGEPKPPVHLKVAIPLEWNEQKKLQEGVLRWEKGSLRGYAKKGDPDADKRRHFKWPVDLQTQTNGAATSLDDDEEGVTARKLWCGDGKHPLQGFRVKAEQGSTVPELHILSVDLGTRFSSAFARLRIHCGPDGKGRLISPDDFTPAIRAHMYRKGTLRLQGENAQVWDHCRDKAGNCVKNAAGQYVYAKQDELYGNDGRGRYPLVKPEEGIDEIAAFKKFADQIVPITSFSIIGTETMTYPEMGDHLIMRMRRRVSRLRSLFNLRWRVVGKTEWRAGKSEPRKPEQQKEHRRAVIELLGGLAFPKTPRLEGEEELQDNRRLRDALNADPKAWEAIKADLEARKEPAKESQRCQRLDATIEKWNWESLAKELDQQLKNYFADGSGTADLLIGVLEHCLPLRKRHWHWNSAEHRLYMDKTETCPQHIPFIKGMRGLSIRRLEQVLRLRQLFQSYAKLEKRHILGEKGIEPTPTKRGDNVDDPCPDLLEKSNELREQRVNQAAHLILAEALGLELKNPAEVDNKKQQKNEVDLHGEYKPILDPKTNKPIPRCSVIVLEDLTRYRTSQDRTRGENSRLMQWAHRAIIKKLTDITKPFGITLMLVDPAFSSRFDSRIGLPGIRVNSVSRGFHEEMPYAAWAKQKGKDGKPSDLANKVALLKEMFDQHQNFKGQLLIALDGGKQFLPVPADASELKKDFCPPNADENAAINIGLRAVAHPDRWDIFPCLRSKELSEDAVQIRNRRGSFATFADGHPRKALRKQGANQAAASSAQNAEPDEELLPDFFVNACNFPGLPQGEAFEPHPETGFNFAAFRRGLFLKRVQQLCDERVAAINEQRLNK
jgi:IS605 OrfB family transposase